MDKKVILITGTNSGFGYLTATQAAAAAKGQLRAAKEPQTNFCGSKQNSPNKCPGCLKTKTAQ